MPLGHSPQGAEDDSGGDIGNYAAQCRISGAGESEARSARNEPKREAKSHRNPEPPASGQPFIHYRTVLTCVGRVVPVSQGSDLPQRLRSMARLDSEPARAA